ncbi:hypothetical protein, partial [Stenotrophomonas muris]
GRAGSAGQTEGQDARTWRISQTQPGEALMYIFADAYEFAVDNVGNLLITLLSFSVVSYVAANVAGLLA